MRVLHLCSGNLYGGVETMLVALARHRGAAPEMEQHFAVCFQGRLSAELAGEGVPVHFLGEVQLRSPWSVLRARRRVREVLRRERIDVVVCHSAWAQVIFGPAVRSGRHPLTLWLHGPLDAGHWLQRLARRTPPEMAVCNSRFTAASVPALYPGLRTEVVHCPVDLTPAAFGEEDRVAVRAELETPGEAVVIVQVSRMEPLKGHPVLLRALGALRGVPGWTCWIVGGAQRPEEVAYLHEQERLAAELGIADRVRFTGERSDVPRLLAAADFQCQPNTGPDAFGIAFVEALRAGIPCVTSALGGAPEVVDERCGILVPPGEVEALASALARLIGDGALRRRLGSAGPARARALCDPAEQLPRLYRLLAGLCAGTAMDEAPVPAAAR